MHETFLKLKRLVDAHPFDKISEVPDSGFCMAGLFPDNCNVCCRIMTDIVLVADQMEAEEDQYDL